MNKGRGFQISKFWREEENDTVQSAAPVRLVVEARERRDKGRIESQETNSWYFPIPLHQFQHLQAPDDCWFAINALYCISCPTLSAFFVFWSSLIRYLRPQVCRMRFPFRFFIEQSIIHCFFLHGTFVLVPRFSPSGFQFRFIWISFFVLLPHFARIFLFFFWRNDDYFLGEVNIYNCNWYAFVEFPFVASPPCCISESGQSCETDFSCSCSLSLLIYISLGF